MEGDGKINSVRCHRCYVIKENEAKRGIPLWLGYKMATQAILPPSQAADSGPKVADFLVKYANTRVTVCSKVANGPYVAAK